MFCFSCDDHEHGNVMPIQNKATNAYDVETVDLNKLCKLNN